MSLMDRMKEQAAQALTKAQQGVSQGKAKIEEAQAKHQWDGLLRNLGAAVYAEQREGGPGDAVTAALAALDAQADHLRAEAEGASSDTSTGAATGQGAEEGPAEAESSPPEGDTASEG